MPKMPNPFRHALILTPFSHLPSHSTGICTFDPGFTSTASCESSITYIDGNKGILLYRG